jgi:hypothetical protein
MQIAATDVAGCNINFGIGKCCRKKVKLLVATCADAVASILPTKMFVSIMTLFVVE